MDLRNPSSEALDALREVCSVGGGNAATALAEFTGGRKIEMEVPRVFSAPFANVAALLGGPEAPVVGVYQELSGGSGGAVLLVLGAAHARSFAAALGANPAVADELSEKTRDAIREAANIVSGAFLTAVARFVGLDIIAGVPCLAEDMAGAVIDTVLCDIGSESDFALILETQFRDASGPFSGLLLIMPSLPSLSAWLRALTS